MLSHSWCVHARPTKPPTGQRRLCGEQKRPPVSERRYTAVQSLLVQCTVPLPSRSDARCTLAASARGAPLTHAVRSCG